MRQDEEFAKQAFDRYLADKGVVNRSWQDGEDPPDFKLSIDGQEFAVEVQWLTEDVRTPRGMVSRKTIYESAKRFIQNIEKTASQQGILHGEFIVFLGDIDNDFYAVQNTLKKGILRFIHNSCNDPELRNDEIQLNHTIYCSIVKTSNTGDTVRLFGPPSEIISFRYLDKYVCKLIQDALITKQRKLEKLDQKKILILRKAITNIDPEISRQCKSDLSYLDDFHTVFIVANENHVLHSQNPDWY